jgi:3-methyladenine DNA glycosylase/8-oxoguanine DNA glycosylase
VTPGGQRRSWRLRRPLDVSLTFGPLRRGRGDPTMRLSPTGLWRATRTPRGPASIRLTIHVRDIEVWAWGPGADWALETAPELIGEHDDPGALVARDPIVGRLQQRLVGLRIGRTGAVLEALVPAILEQKVTGIEAWRSFRAIVRTWSEPAPGPERLWLPPDPAVLAAQPTWEWHRLGVERKRADAIRVACSRSARLEPITDLDPPVAYRRLTALPGVGRWTAAEVGGRALGDPDAVSVGDFHIPHLVTWTLAGEARGSDARMLELLEPYRGQRGRVIRLIEAGGRRLPRRAPRRALRRIAAL